MGDLKIIKKKYYTMYNPHNTVSKTNNNYGDYLLFVAIDPGKNNFAIRIEIRTIHGDVFCVFFDKADFSKSKDITQTINLYFNDLFEHFVEAHYIIIEKQIDKNMVVSNIFHFVLLYMCTNLKNRGQLPKILVVNPKIKCWLLGMPKNIKGKDIKKWAIVKALDLLKRRRDNSSLKTFSHHKNKQDDLADVVCYIEAMIVLLSSEP